MRYYFVYIANQFGGKGINRYNVMARDKGEAKSLVHHVLFGGNVAFCVDGGAVE